MKKQNILISLLAVACLVGCTNNKPSAPQSSGAGNTTTSGGNDQVTNKVVIEDFGTTKFEAEKFDVSNWYTDPVYAGADIIDEAAASGGKYLGAADKDASAEAVFFFELKAYSKVVFGAAYAQTEDWLESDLEMDKTYTFEVENVRNFAFADGKNILPKRSSATSWQLMEYAPETLYPGTYKVTLKANSEAPKGCPSIDYVQFKTSDPSVQPVNPSEITEVPENDFHNLAQYQYLMDENWENFATYADGKDYSAPNAIKLKFDDVENASKYYVQVSETNDFSAAPVKEVTTKYYELWNAKLSQKYYYKAATSEAGLASAKVKDLTTTSLAPRVINVPNVLNFRDIGGWGTTLVSGAKLNQGLYYRCAQLNQSGYSSTRSELDSQGKGLAAIKDLGIKVDIDMRDSYNVPSKSPADTTDWPVKLVKASVASSTEDGRWEGYHEKDKNIGATYKTIFETIANCDKEPALLHCTYGADRTGIVSFFLEALLGVEYKDLARDYVWTKFTQGRDPNPNGEFAKWVQKTEACEGDNFADKMENHLMASPINIEKSTLEHIREIFIPGYVAKA